MASKAKNAKTAAGNAMSQTRRYPRRRARFSPRMLSVNAATSGSSAWGTFSVFSGFAVVSAAKPSARSLRDLQSEVIEAHAA